MSTKLLRLKAAAARTGYHPATVFKKAQDPLDDFPGIVRTGPNSIAFVESEIEEWIEARIQERDEKGFTPKDANPRDNLPEHLRNTSPRVIARDRKRQEAEASA